MNCIIELNLNYRHNSKVKCDIPSVTGADIDIGFLSDQFKYSDHIAVGETFYRQRIPSIDSNLFIILEIPVKTENNNRKASDYNRF